MANNGVHPLAGEVVGWMVWACDYPECLAVLKLLWHPRVEQEAKSLGWGEQITPGDVHWERECYCPKHFPNMTEEPT